MNERGVHFAGTVAKLPSCLYLGLQGFQQKRLPRVMLERKCRGGEITLFRYFSVFRLLLRQGPFLSPVPQGVRYFLELSRRRSFSPVKIPKKTSALAPLNVRCPRLETPFQLPLVGSLAVSEGESERARERGRVALLNGGGLGFLSSHMTRWLFPPSSDRYTQGNKEHIVYCNAD